MSINQTKPLPESHEELVDYGTEDEDNDPSPRHRDRSASEDTFPPADQSEFDHKNGTQSESDHNESLSKSDAQWIPIQEMKASPVITAVKEARTMRQHQQIHNRQTLGRQIRILTMKLNRPRKK